MRYSIEYLLKNMNGFNEMPFIYYANAKSQSEALNIFLKDFKLISKEKPIINYIREGD
jgi:hypothetical protein